MAENDLIDSDHGDVEGLGGSVDEYPVIGRENRLLQRAVRQRWPIPEDLKAKIVRRQVKIAVSKKSSNRESTSAARCLTTMEGQNLEAHKEAQTLIQNQILIANSNTRSDDDDDGQSIPQVVITMPDNGRD